MRGAVLLVRFMKGVRGGGCTACRSAMVIFSEGDVREGCALLLPVQLRENCLPGARGIGERVEDVLLVPVMRER